MAENYNQIFRTMTGMNFEEAIQELTDILPPEAYREVVGQGVDLTDINPIYLTKALTKVFGFCGVGWAYEYDEIFFDSETRTSKAGNEYTLNTAIIPNFRMRYQFIDENGNKAWSEFIPGAGGSANKSKPFAVKGAITNALSSTATKLLWQFLVYAGKLNHKNAAAAWKALHEETTGGAPEPEQVTPVEETSEPAPKEVTAAATVSPTPAAKQEPEPEPETSGKETPMFAPYDSDWDRETKVTWAKGFPVAEYLALPKGGDSLEVIFEDETFGEPVLKFLARKSANADGNKFEPVDEYEKNLSGAASLLLQLEKK